MDLILAYGSEDSLNSLSEVENSLYNSNYSVNNKLVNIDQNVEISVYPPDVEIVRNFENIDVHNKETTYLSIIQEMNNTKGNAIKEKDKENRLYKDDANDAYEKKSSQT